jgi:hypothetical protein
MLKVTWHSCLTGEVEEALDHLPDNIAAVRWTKREKVRAELAA